MDIVTSALLHLLQVLIGLVRALMGGIEGWLRTTLAQLHVTGDLQTIIVTLVPVLILVAVVRLMGGLLRWVLILVLVLLLVQVLASHPVDFGPGQRPGFY